MKNRPACDCRRACCGPGYRQMAWPGFGYRRAPDTHCKRCSCAVLPPTHCSRMLAFSRGRRWIADSGRRLLRKDNRRRRGLAPTATPGYGELRRIHSPRCKPHATCGSASAAVPAASSPTSTVSPSINGTGNPISCSLVAACSGVSYRAGVVDIGLGRTPVFLRTAPAQDEHQQLIAAGDRALTRHSSRKSVPCSIAPSHLALNSGS